MKVVIIKGNPDFIKSKVAKKYYRDIELFLKANGVKEVVFDPGEDFTCPDKTADFYIGHSRGAGRARCMKTGEEWRFLRFGDPDGIMHPVDREWHKQPVGDPPDEHFLFIEEQKKAIVELVNELSHGHTYQLRNLSQESLNNLTQVESKYTVSSNEVGTLYHLSFSTGKAGLWRPLTPAGTEDVNQDDMEFGEPPVPRISMSPTLEGCFRAIYPNIDHYFRDKKYPYLDIYAYKARFKGRERTVTPEVLTKQRWVWDAHITQEHWVLDSTVMELVGRYRFFNTEDGSKGLATRPFNDPKEAPNSYVGPRTVSFKPLESSPSLESRLASLEW